MFKVLVLTLAGCMPKDDLYMEPIGGVAASVAEVEEAAADTDTVLLDGTPEVPPDLVGRLSRYLETRSARLTGLSDSGDGMLVLTRFAETYQVHRIDQPMGARTQVTFRSEPVNWAGFRPGEPDTLVLRADEGGNEQHQLFLLDLATGTTERLTDGEGRVSEPRWSPSGDKAAFSNTARNHKDFDIWLWDGQAEPRLAVEVEGAWGVHDWMPDDRWMVLEHYISVTDGPLWLADSETGQRLRLSPEEPAASYPAAVAGDGHLYVTTDREGEFIELYEVTLPGGWQRGFEPAAVTWTPLTRDIPWTVEGLDLSPDGSTVAFTVNEHGVSSLYLLDTATRKHRKVEGLPQGIVNRMRFARQGSTLGFTLYGATSPGDAWTYDVATDDVTRWTASEVGGLSPAGFVEPELIEYPTFDDRSIPAWYYRPEGEGPFPVVIAIHGGPEGQARPYFHYRHQFLARELGVAVITPNVRGSKGYGKSWLELDNGMLREDSVKDIGALLDWIEQRPELDQDRVGVRGGSYGGYMVLACLVHYGDRIKAGVDVVGIANFVTFLENTKEYRQDLRRVEYGDERDPEMRAHLDKISPVHSADSIDSALFVAHGANDPRVPADEAEQIVEAVRNNGKDVWYMLARNEGHGFRKKENVDTYSQLEALFWQRHLVGE